ncbi:mannitol dehydrogenase family protein [Breznakiella homolactica]|uniref:Mannitol dehydrogenase family protein n=1 Tax=Breznakiella homolactica TaxID=2798577 RepID=A0A7T7XN34_9SPIR|nr:mannitol dehydrogenase family protein [Breznakiella homolactica]QQO09390.1 mannitol dehydrogenase family protein [Breznakiella homolactica]
MAAVHLNRKNLSGITSGVKVPEYSPDNLKPSIVHIGLGHFHRAHQAVYLDDLLNLGSGNAGIFEINTIPDGTGLAEKLAGQDNLYTLISRDAGGAEEVRVIGSILGYLSAPDNREAAIARMASAETEIISLTVTEKGYYYDTVTEDLSREHPDIVHDITNPREPKTVIAYIAASLKLRSETNKKPVTIMSCDNFPSNGKILKKCILSFCETAYPDLIPWIESNTAFPSSMVDRITPATTEADVQYLESAYGIKDALPVCCEDFRQWVLEDNFKSAVPDLAKAGVEIVPDVEPYELMKIRLLNGSHSALSYLAYLLGYREVAPAMGDPLLKTFIRNFYMEEITATLQDIPGTDFRVYKDTLISRFTNTNIGDHILRLTLDGSKKIPNAVLLPLEETLRQGRRCNAILLALAGWARFLEGTDEAGVPIPVEDCGRDTVMAAAASARRDPEGFLRAIGVHGIGADEMRSISGIFKDYLEKLHRDGTRRTLADFTGVPD